MYVKKRRAQFLYAIVKLPRWSDASTSKNTPGKCHFEIFWQGTWWQSSRFGVLYPYVSGTYTNGILFTNIFQVAKPYEPRWVDADPRQESQCWAWAESLILRCFETSRRYDGWVIFTDQSTHMDAFLGNHIHKTSIHERFFSNGYQAFDPKTPLWKLSKQWVRSLGWRRQILTKSSENDWNITINGGLNNYRL